VRVEILEATSEDAAVSVTPKILVERWTIAKNKCHGERTLWDANQDIYQGYVWNGYA
jgi:hypothetical protein